MRSSSVHRLRLPLSNQGLTQCGEDVIHVICIRHDKLTSRMAIKERKRNKPQSHYKDKPRHPRAGMVIVYVEHSTTAKSERLSRRVPRRVPKRIGRMIEGNVHGSMR